MTEDGKPERSRLKAHLLALLQAGAGSLVLAATAVMAPPAATAATPSSDSLLKRADEARAQLVRSLPDSELIEERPVQLAFWGNIGRPRWPNWPNGWNNWSRWGNLSRPRWPNWPNGWHNWPNWRNF